MNRQLAPCVFITITASLATWFPGQLNAASTNEARVTRVKNRVQLENPKNAEHRASINDIVHEENFVRTDNGSGCELTFSDDTVVRLAAHTEFDYNRGTRGLNLRNGAVLIQVPKAARVATLRAGNVAAAVAGTNEETA